MPLVAARCTQCGAELEVEKTQEAAICKFCGTPFIVEKAINNYAVTNNNYINAQQVIVAGNETADNLAEAGEKHLRMHNYKNAEECFDRLEKDFPSDYRGPRGKILVWTHNFDISYLAKDYEKWIENKHQKFAALAPKDEMSSFTRRLNNYYRSFDLARDIKNTNQEIDVIQEKVEKAAGIIGKGKMNVEYVASFIFIPLGLIWVISLLMGETSIAGKIIGSLISLVVTAGAFFFLQFEYMKLINGKQAEIRQSKERIFFLEKKREKMMNDYNEAINGLQ